MKNCGKRFHSEVGKFRFLNELIKVVSPKVSLSLNTFFSLHMCVCVNYFFDLLVSTSARGHQSLSRRRFWS